jgi:uncharacterized membrane protein
MAPHIDRLRVRQSLIAVPSLYVVGAILLGIAAPHVDSLRDGGTANVDTARDLLTATATGMIAFTGFVLSGVLVVVQFAAGSYSPRLVLWFRRDKLIKHAIGIFLAAFVFALVALRRIEEPGSSVSPDVTVGVALLLLIGACVLFLAVLQRVTDPLRPRALYPAVMLEGIRATRQSYPERLGHTPVLDRAAWASAEPRSVALHGRPGVLTSFDRDALVAVAERHGAVIELALAMGEYARPHRELLRVHGGPVPEPEALARHVHIAAERTIEQDPEFAMRIVVDTAIRALSPAVNDPTTGTQALDVLEVLVGELAGRDLQASLARDAAGVVRVVWHSPTWDDVLDLAFDEIRGYGAGSLQVARRMRAVLEDLLAATPPQRHAGLREHLARLDAAVLTAYPAGSRELDLARVPDRMGLGLGRA